LAATSFIVIDFEGTTPTGRSPEPIEMAAVGLRYREGSWQRTARFEALMRPPAHAPVVHFDVAQTGITTAMVADRPPAADVLARLDARLTSPPYLLVAPNAPTEAGMLPDLPFGYSLDALIGHFGIPRPSRRHRAMPDVEATIAVFSRLIDTACSRGEPDSVRGLVNRAGYQPKTVRTVQESIL